MKYLSLVMLCFGLLVSHSFASTLIIGNAGEGYRIDGQLYLRDFVESNVHVNPYFGTKVKTDYSLLKENKFFSDLDLDINLVNQKLNDLNIIYPGLADALVKVMSIYSWTLVPDQLGLLPDDGQIIKIPYTERVQIANRSLLNIRLQKSYWQQLNPKNRVGLFMHELIFALLKPIKLNNQSEFVYQPSRLARQIVGFIFSESTYLDPQVANSVLNLMQMAFGLNYPSLEAQYSIRFSLMKQEELKLTIDEAVLEKNLDNFLNRMCTQNEKKSEENWVFFVVSNHPKVIQSPFHTSYGLEIGMRIDFETWASSFKVSSLDLTRQCESVLKNKILLLPMIPLVQREKLNIYFIN